MLFLRCLVIALPLAVGAGLELPPHLDLSNREVMRSEELVEFIQEWDTGRVNSLFDLPVASVSKLQEFPDGTTHYALRFNNREIVQRVVDLYIAEHQRNWAITIKGAENAIATRGTPRQHEDWQRNLDYDKKCLESSILQYGKLYNNNHLHEKRGDGEAEADYHDLLFPVAESTFCVEMYQCVLQSSFSSKLRTTYLAYVRPEDTVALILRGNVGMRDGVPAARDRIYFDDECGGIGVSDAFDFANKLVSENKNVARKISTDVRHMIAKYALIYCPTSSRDELLLSNQDYGLRATALQILAAIGVPDDLPLVQRIATTTPVPAEPELLKDQSDMRSIEQFAHAAEDGIKSRRTPKPITGGN